MSDDFNVGDVVVCVNSGRIACLDHPSKGHNGSDGPRLGGFTRVIAFAVGATFPSGARCACPMIVLPSGKEVLRQRFRKLPPASDEFTRQMRALRPHNTRVPA